MLRVVVGGDGRIRFEGLRPDDHVSIWITGLRANLCYYAEGIRPGGDPRKVKLVPGRVIQGRVLGLDINPPHLWIEGPGGMIRLIMTGPDGEFQTPAVPPGDWSLVVPISGGKNGETRRVPIGGSKEIEIDLR